MYACCAEDWKVHPRLIVACQTGFRREKSGTESEIMKRKGSNRVVEHFMPKLDVLATKQIDKNLGRKWTKVPKLYKAPTIVTRNRDLVPRAETSPSSPSTPILQLVSLQPTHNLTTTTLASRYSASSLPLPLLPPDLRPRAVYCKFSTPGWEALSNIFLVSAPPEVRLAAGDTSP
ncbi:hypothetical protein BU23DRAFT_563886 [Bimuria novae-zelandiae CBS 107.79]|uniref:Uncharacterized protein n=1 Tax=Bimuria novae-zelandiae CBS 107.79 TaxID=1447943 RepID=A0A6A5VQG5_9PLEO|nr:hypothetical protein BU23DRAFT_563886 [Bimuria novae-zelandiae CBS 107.79]